MKSFNEDARVMELIDATCGNWNEDVVRRILDEYEAELVCSLPMSQTSLQDKYIWAPTKNGIFNVKSAYHMNMSRTRRVKGLE